MKKIATAKASEDKVKAKGLRGLCELLGIIKPSASHLKFTEQELVWGVWQVVKGKEREIELLKKALWAKEKELSEREEELFDMSAVKPKKPGFGGFVPTVYEKNASLANGLEQYKKKLREEERKAERKKEGLSC